MAVNIRRGARSRVACSTGHCDQRYARCNLHGDVGMAQRMHRSVRQPCRVTHLMYPCVHGTGIYLCAALRDEQPVCVFPPIAHVVAVLIVPYLVFHQHRQQLIRYGNHALAALCFGSLIYNSDARHRRDRSLNGDGSLFEVDVRPLQSAELTTSHACQQQDHCRCFVSYIRIGIVFHIAVLLFLPLCFHV